VHGRGSRLAWGLSEDQRERCARRLGWESREERWRPRWSVPASGQSETVGRGVGRTPEAGRWGWEVLWVCVPTWRVGERGGKGWKRSLQDFGPCMHGFFLPPSLLSIFFRVKHRAGVMLGDGLLCWVGLDAKPRWEKVLIQNHKRK
jgi:hypothetical protein